MPREKQNHYRPTDREPFMNERQRDYFRNKLLAWREDILREAQETLQHLQDENQNHPDLADRASSETERAIELRARDRQRKLIAKIDAALQRIEDGTYGFCEETGEPISLRRLEARPIATLSITAQEGHEQRERVYRDDWLSHPRVHCQNRSDLRGYRWPRAFRLNISLRGCLALDGGQRGRKSQAKKLGVGSIRANVLG